jgi:diguanylate cyclase (GGDEF)-like protein/PAS domain S-box-containing protein
MRPTPTADADWTARDTFMPYAERVALLRAVMTDSPGCAVAVYDQPIHFIEPDRFFADVGVDLAGHPVLEGRSAVEYVEVADIVRVGPAVEDAACHGSSVITVRLRSGGDASLTYIDFQAEHGVTCAIFTPSGGVRMPMRPEPTALAGAPRLGVVHRNRTGTIIGVDDGLVALLGWEPAELLGNGSLAIVHPDDHAQAIANWVHMLERPGEACRWRCRYKKKDGTWLWVESTNLYRNEHEDVRTELFDVDAEVRAQDALAAREEVLRVLAEALPVGVARLDRAAAIDYANDRLGSLLGIPTPVDTASLLSTTGDGAAELGDALTALVEEGRPGRVDTTCAGRHLEWTLRPLHDRDGACAGGIVCVADVTEAVQLRARLVRQATTDALTGCHNRAFTLDAVHAALAAGTGDDGVAVVFVDLNAFKPVNDCHGHAAGDELLSVVAQRIRGATRPGDVVGRIGGDEFVVVSAPVSDRGSAAALAERIARSLQGEAVISCVDRPLRISASIGVAWAAGGCADELLAAADRAMYEAKRTGRLTPVMGD